MADYVVLLRHAPYYEVFDEDNGILNVRVITENSRDRIGDFYEWLEKQGYIPEEKNQVFLACSTVEHATPTMHELLYHHDLEASFFGDYVLSDERYMDPFLLEFIKMHLDNHQLLFLVTHLEQVSNFWKYYPKYFWGIDDIRIEEGKWESLKGPLDASIFDNVKQKFIHMKMEE